MKGKVPVALGISILIIGSASFAIPQIIEARSETKTLTIAHIHNDSAPVYQSLEDFASGVNERTTDNLDLEIYPNGALGDERVMLELVQTGVIDMVKVNAGALESFDPSFSVFSLPYVFSDEEHFERVMDSDTVQQMYEDLADIGLKGITYFDAGARSFYTANNPIEKPEDLSGLKIRVMTNKTSIETMKLLGAAPTPLPASEVYTGLQQGVIDGAESSSIALVDANHGEVAKYFSYDEHTRIPDFLIMSDQTWNGLTEEEQAIIEEEAKASTLEHNERWKDMIDEGVVQAEEEMGVTFNEVDQEPFRELVEPLVQESRENPQIAEILDAFSNLE
ncbi:TRAP transporter substrate-binding protein [Alkalicoccobacillus murimartini]|uniref:Tripartite ATP-independent transporter DctP family solute receptor n=1 Tax=Alkalicoccobacillus murimartini TaxID=171685 RepID=A0ABT9YJK8_9BACI|nr:TRAP transporter substrate-binding protein [Alkalicoccobacillus murimartini]MDQ0207209.1 tripartite ATP-independent transporter DctP family solute receptor [Alkalicoccobacillus murimartini]